MTKKLLIFLIFFSTDIAFALPEGSVSAVSNSTIQEASVVLDRNGSLIFSGFEGPGLIEIYSIIGNKIVEDSTQDMFQFKLVASLEAGNMYIIRVISNGKTKTFKIVAS